MCIRDRSWSPRRAQSWGLQMHQAAWLGGYEWVEPCEEQPRKGAGKQGEQARWAEQPGVGARAVIGGRFCPQQMAPGKGAKSQEQGGSKGRAAGKERT
eukprot:7728014-Alexandrium_andersonii.AAC.1